MNLYELILDIIEKKGPGTFHTICDEVNKIHTESIEKRKPVQISQIKSVVSRKKELFSVQDDMVFIREEMELENLSVIISGYPRPAYKIYIDFVENRFYFFEWCMDGKPEPKMSNEIYIGSIEEFKKELLRLKIWNWERDYQLDYLVLDGMSWSVKLKTKGRMYESGGLQAFPKNWNRFCKAISQLIGMKLY